MCTTIWTWTSRVATRSKLSGRRFANRAIRKKEAVEFSPVGSGESGESAPGHGLFTNRMYPPSFNYFYRMAKRTKKNPRPTPPKTTRSWFPPERTLQILVFLFPCLLYFNTLSHEYTQDDAIVIYDNEFTTQGFAGIPDLLRYDTFRGFFKTEGKDKLVAGGRYRPLTPVMFAMEWALFGPETFDNVEDPALNAVQFLHHLVSVLLYGLTCLVLFVLLRRLFAPRRSLEKPDNRATFLALAAALLFAAHPIHTEVVANIKGRDEIVVLLGSLAAIYVSIRAFLSKNILWNIGAGVLFFLALMSKENAITFVAVVPLVYYFFTKAKTREIVRQTLPFAAAALVFLFIRGAVIGWDLGEPSRELLNNPFLKIEGNQWVDFTAGERLATVFLGLGKYLQLLIAPVQLSHDYYPYQLGIPTFGDWRVLLSLLIHLGAGAYALYRLPKRDPVSFGILFYLLTISIVSNIVINIGVTIAERFIFVSSVGFLLIVAVLLYRLGKKLNNGVPKSLTDLRPVLVGLAVLLSLYSVKTVVRNFTWKDNYTLFLTDIEKSSDSAKLRNASGGELLAQSIKPKNEARAASMQREAVGHLQEAIRIHPTYRNAYLLLGNAHNYLKEYEKSIEYYQRALELSPDYELATTNLAYTYRDAGRYAGEQRGDLAAALRYLNLAYQTLPTDYETLRLLGVAYGNQGDQTKALNFFERARDAAPNNADAWLNLSLAYANAGQMTDSQQARARALELDPQVLSKREQ